MATREEIREGIETTLKEIVWGEHNWSNITKAVLSYLDSQGVVLLKENQQLPYCEVFEWFNIDKCEAECDFELMKAHCTLLKAGFGQYERLIGDEANKT